MENKQAEIQQYDVLIVGAGFSGIGMAYQLQKQCPNKTFALLEARETMGGTWDLFRYPGIRSDSDMYTLGFPFYPWKEPRAIADGPSILKYIKETASHFGIDKKILYGNKITSAEWTDENKRWNLVTEKGSHFSCSFLIMCSGYYDYDEGYTPDFPGRENYKGKFIHPQFWDESLDYSDKKIVVIGSGATSITLVPELAKKASHVTMLQRSPSYVVELPSQDKIANGLNKFFSQMFAHKLARWKNILIAVFFYNFCQLLPKQARDLILAKVKKSLRNANISMKNFEPGYSPWDQRVCFVPDGDLFKTLSSGKASILTDNIKTFTDKGIELQSGQNVEADIVVSATGLKLKFLGGLKVKVNGETLETQNLVPYKSSMFNGVPNLGMVFGYINASWTLKSNLTSDWIASILKHMDQSDYSVVMPEKSPAIQRLPLVNMSSGYFKRGDKILPRQGGANPWKVHQNFFLDLYNFKGRPLEDRDLHFQ